MHATSLFFRNYKTQLMLLLRHCFTYAMFLKYKFVWYISNSFFNLFVFFNCQKVIFQEFNHTLAYNILKSQVCFFITLFNYMYLIIKQKDEAPALLPCTVIIKLTMFLSYPCECETLHGYSCLRSVDIVDRK